MDAITLFTSLKSSHIKTGDEKEWGKVYSSLFEMPNAPYTTFIKLGYFRRCKGAVERFQDIPNEYKTFNNPIKLFISHKWAAKDHPDKSRATLKSLLSLTQNCDEHAAIWWDYCSLPQRSRNSGKDDRSTELKDFFKFQLSLIPLVILDSQCMFLWSTDGINSGWCCAELLIAQALLQHLNKMIYERRDEFTSPPLFVSQIGSQTLVETDLIRFEHRMFQKIYCSEVAMARHKELIVWMNNQLNGGLPTPYSQVIKHMSPELISKMVAENRLAFTHGADTEIVSEMLFKIYHRLSLEPFENFKWAGKKDFFSLWHYVKGCLGNCIVPTFSYWF